MNSIYFKNYDFEVNKGELVGIIGPNGSGKTTFLKSICGRLKNDYIFIDKKNISLYSLEYKKNNIVCVMDDNIYNTSNVLDELNYYLNILNRDMDIIDDFISYFDIENIKKSNFSDIRVEDRVFVKILSLLIIKPTLLCIDDLLTYLNNEKKMKILNYIKDNNIILMIVTSNMEELLLMDKVLIINKGKKVIYDKKDNVLMQDRVFKELGLSLPFIYDINNMLKDYELIEDNHVIQKDLVNVLWK